MRGADFESLERYGYGWILLAFGLVFITFENQTLENVALRFALHIV